jgi:1-pyrroline-5-carboxylate dehydrogenase
MNNIHPHLPLPINEPIKSYAPNSPEKASLLAKLAEMKATHHEIGPIIGGETFLTNDTETLRPPHERKHTLGTLHHANDELVQKAIQVATDARHDWMRLHWTDRAAVFLKAADLLSTSWRDTLNAATMLGQSKNAFQAEIDAACELIDFLRFNVSYMQMVYDQQPISSQGIWNKLQYRPLEGFVFAVAPFNFTAISGNLAAAPAMMGNTILWKPSTTSALSSYYIYKLFEAAGLPQGVMNFLPSHPPVASKVFDSPQLGGLHFTGSTQTFQWMWKTIGNNIAQYKSYPRIVGETGGKDFIFAHPSADPAAVATAITRGAFEYQGQKCSAASRVYIPSNLWASVKDTMCAQLDEIKMGTVEDLGNFVNAVIDQRAYDKITGYIAEAKQTEGVTVVHGGNYSDAEGFFIQPTVLKVEDPKYRTMCEEIFGPVVTIYVYDEAKWMEIPKLIDESSPYALTGSIFATDRGIIAQLTDALTDAAGNFYINDKPTGAVVGQQPFGGGRASGTNDKAGSYLNLLRWVSPRTIKETFNPPLDYKYPFLGG